MATVAPWTDRLHWPVLRITEPKGIIAPYETPEALLSVRYIGLPDLEKVRDGSRPSALRRVLLRILNPRVPIIFDRVKIDENYPLSEVQRSLAENVRRYPEYWSEFDISTVEEFVEAMNRTQSMPELFRLAGADVR